MPHRNGHTTLEMSPRPHGRVSPRAHEDPSVHRGHLPLHGDVRSLSPARVPHGNGSHGNISGVHGNISGSRGNVNHPTTHLSPENYAATHHSDGNVSNRSHHGNYTNSDSNLPTRENSPTPHARSRRHIHDVASPADGASQPLLETDSHSPKPPIAGPEIDDFDDNEGNTATPESHPGVDDGFFPAGHEKGHEDGNDGEGANGHGDEGIDELRISIPKTDEHGNVVDDELHDVLDGVFQGGNYPASRSPYMMSHSNITGVIDNRFGEFPYAPEFAPGAVPRVIPDVNVYQQKKNLAQGMMDLALLSANANQLRYVLEAGALHPYYYFSLFFISASLITQIGVGVGLIMNSSYNVTKEDDICKADRINNMTVIGIFLITVLNVFITSFGVADMQRAAPPPNN